MKIKILIAVLVLMLADMTVAQTRTDSVVNEMENYAQMVYAGIQKISANKSNEAVELMKKGFEPMTKCLSKCSKNDTIAFSAFEKFYVSDFEGHFVYDEDNVKNYALHYFVASMSECKFLVDYKKKKNSWKTRLFESIDHFHVIDTVLAKQKIDTYRAMIRKDYGKNSLEYFLATDICLNITDFNDTMSYEKVRKEYLKSGKRWKSDKFYSDFLASYIPNTLRLLFLFTADEEKGTNDTFKSDDWAETGVQKYNRIAGIRKKTTHYGETLSTLSCDQLKHHEFELSNKAMEKEEKGNYSLAVKLMQQAINIQTLIIKNQSDDPRKTNIEIREISRLTSLLERMQTKDGGSDAYVNASICILDELFSFNDTVAIHTSVQLANGWEEKYNGHTSLVKYLDKKAFSSAFSKKLRIYERACLLRAEANILSMYRDGLIDACKILQTASQMVYKAEGRSNHYFDLKTSEILFYIHRGSYIGMTYSDIVRKAESFFEELTQLPNYKEYYEYVETKYTLINMQSKANKDWLKIISYSDELINYPQDDKNPLIDDYSLKYKTCIDGNFYSILYDLSWLMPTCYWDYQHDNITELCMQAYRNLDDCSVNPNIARQYLSKGNDRIIDLVQRGFFYNDVFEDELASASFIAANTNESEIGSMAFNNILLCKGLQLYSINILTMIHDRGINKEMESLFNRYKILQRKVEINSINKNPDLKRIKTELSDVRYDLFSKASEVDYFTNYFHITAEDITKCLKRNELAIEFSSYTTLYDATSYIIAHVLDGNTHNVNTIKVCKREDLQTLTKNPTPSAMYDIIWKNIMSQYNDITKVYFSPIDILHRLSIENGIEGKYLSYRVSSLRQLLPHEASEKQKNAVLYGGLLYNNDTYDIGEERGACNSLYLPSTLTEVKRLHSILQDNGWKSQIFKDSIGTEKSMSNINFDDVTILHIATHGYFHKSDITGDLSLSNSGLLFSNCSKNIDKIPLEPNDDGILTALEVSDMNLQKLDIVVLSACDTGLGEVTAEGVFGLQRGFKKAGVNSILMSLWKVDDDATCKLMTEFYTNWITRKMTKHDALETAKKVVRETKGWEDPKYWAPFILLDALD